jgi:hypothetical protein
MIDDGAYEPPPVLLIIFDFSISAVISDRPGFELLACLGSDPEAFFLLVGARSAPTHPSLFSLVSLRVVL